jgi:hypothetical protein
MFGFNPTSSTRLPTTAQSGIDLREETQPASSSRPTTESMAPVQPSRQYPQTEEGRVQRQEQEPDTRRTVVEQGTPPQGSPKSVATEHFELSPEKTGLQNVGLSSQQVHVKHVEIPDEKIIDFANAHAVDATGNGFIIDILSKTEDVLRRMSTSQMYLTDEQEASLSIFLIGTIRNWDASVT